MTDSRSKRKNTAISNSKNVRPSVKKKIVFIFPKFKILKVLILEDVISILGMLNNGKNYVFDKIEMTVQSGNNSIKFYYKK